MHCQCGCAGDRNLVVNEISSWGEFLEYLEESHDEVEEFPGNKARFLHRQRSIGCRAWQLRSRMPRPWLALGVYVGPASALRARGALVANGHLPIGALALEEGIVTLRQTLPLSSLSVANLEHTLETLLDTRSQLLELVDLPQDVATTAPFAYVFRGKPGSG